MFERLNHRERVIAALKGEPVDRLPVSVWRHFYDREMTLEGELDSLVQFQQRYDWDFTKVNLRAHYHCEDWGVSYRYSGDPHEGPELERTPIATARDWGNLDRLDPSKGNLGAHLVLLGRLRRALGREVPLIITVFTPLGVAARMVESYEVIQQHMSERPDAVRAALEAITETFAAYVPLCLEAGADGLFFATVGWGSRDRMNDQQYQEWGQTYDLRVLQQAQGGWFNVLHVCGSRNRLRALARYPVHAFNWDAQDPTNPSLKEGLEITSRVVIGGIPQQRVATMAPEEVKAVVKECVAQTGGQRFMVGSGCTMSTGTPHENLMALKEALREGG